MGRTTFALTITRDNPCRCNCRHKARWICRDMFEQENKEAKS